MTRGRRDPWPGVDPDIAEALRHPRRAPNDLLTAGREWLDEFAAQVGGGADRARAVAAANRRARASRHYEAAQRRRNSRESELDSPVRP